MSKIFFIIFIFLSFPAIAQTNVNLNQWSKLPILHEGRLKPIDSFARVHLKKISGHQNINGQTAEQWLAEVLFSPDEAVNKPVFKVRNFEQYGLTENKNKLYSYIEIVPVLDKKREIIDTLLKSNAQKWTAEQRELIDLYNNAGIHAQLLRSLTGLLPLNIGTEENQNYLSLKDKKRSNAIKLIEAATSNNFYFRIIPAEWNNFNGEWISPWQVIKEKEITDKNLTYLKNWEMLANSYRDNDQILWNNSLNNFPSSLITTRLKTEHLYNTLKLLTIAVILYLLSFFLLIFKNIFEKNIFQNVAYMALFTGLIANGLDIILRIYILERAPVGTLYESIIFVSFICVSGCLLLEKKYKNQTGLLLGSVLGTLLLLTAKSFSGDDTMNTLVAVLNTNFWLLTHVICITIGYAVCFITAMVSHYYLALKIWAPYQQALLKQFKNAIKTLIILSLLFTAIGTILGGIWADQSWGRFWGWDPKENGALLIVLWLIWLLHGRISQHISETGFIVGSAFLSIIVVLSWFGINLLNVGLHSYGFITGVALGISVFCTIEFLIISGLWILIRQKAITS